MKTTKEIDTTKRFFTSESVTEGHPDKMCDQISDAILDAYLKSDANARVACEVLACTGTIFVAGQISSTANVDIQQVVRDTVKEIGYTRAKFGFDADSCGVLISLDKQSADIALGVDKSEEYKTEGDAKNLFGAGDQGMMFGFASDETEELMPLAIMLSHKIAARLAQVRKDGTLPYLRPDGKCQVTVEYDGDIARRVDTVVLSTQHDSNVDNQTIKNDMVEKVIKKVIPSNLLDQDTKYIVNPTGRFEIGGPAADTGLTGRKIIVDTYGGYCAHGGGAFSGKDPTKADRSAAYMARYICKNLVAAGFAKKVQLQISYAIGRSKPVSIDINAFGTAKLPDEKIAQIVAEEFDLRPSAIIKKLDLQKPIYQKTAAYGHFGKSDFSWEQLDAVARLKKRF